MSVLDVATESYNFWSNKTKNTNAVFSLLGNEEGETGFNFTAVGDKKTGGAHGIFQWHDARIADIKKNTGIDILTATHLQMLEAAYWEMNNGAYRKVWPELESSQSVYHAVTVLVKDYERSAHQSSDVAKRVAYSLKWQLYFVKKPTISMLHSSLSHLIKATIEEK